MLTATTTQRMCRVQQMLQALHRDALSRLRTPDGFSAELHAQRAHQLQMAVFELWHLSMWLPTDAANDGHSPPVAA